MISTFVNFSLLSPTTFSDTCATLLERMINTVPSTVTLTDPIAEPFDYVVNEPFLSYQDDTFFLTTAIRVCILCSQDQPVTN